MFPSPSRAQSHLHHIQYQVRLRASQCPAPTIIKFTIVITIITITTFIISGLVVEQGNPNARHQPQSPSPRLSFLFALPMPYSPSMRSFLIADAKLHGQTNEQSARKKCNKQQPFLFAFSVTRRSRSDVRQSGYRYRLHWCDSGQKWYKLKTLLMWLWQVRTVMTLKNHKDHNDHDNHDDHK